MANNEDEDILDSEHLGTVLAFPSAVQEAIDQVNAHISFYSLHKLGVKCKQFQLRYLYYRSICLQTPAESENGLY